MSNKEQLKKVIEKDFNQINNYKEIIKKVEKNKMKKNNLLKWSLVPIGLLVIIIGIIFLNYNNHLLVNKTYIDKENNLILNINDLSNIGVTKMDLDIKIVNDVNIPYPFKINGELNIPSDLTQTKNYVVYTKKNQDSKDYDVIASYVMHLTDGNERTMLIRYAKNQVPLKDYYFKEDNSKVTTINGINLIIYKYEESFYTTFSYNDYNFDIETINITEQELANYLVSIFK